MARSRLAKRFLPRIPKRFLPRGLMGRSLLILVTPLVLVQLVAAYVFFGTHWDLVTRRLASGLAGDIGAVVEMMRLHPGEADRAELFALAAQTMELQITLLPGDILRRTGMIGAAPQLADDIMGYSLKDNLIGALAERVGRPVFIDAERNDGKIEILVQLSDGVLDVHANRKRLYSPTTMIFVLWMFGTSLLLLFIATLFTRNQVRAVKRLAVAADAFGKGRPVPDFKPEGAIEVRQAGVAFALMRDRLKSQVDQRTEMLAGVSHDLRTPLTRMKLQLAMMPDSQSGDLHDDVLEMERMIEGYLAFARGEDSEATRPTDLAALIEDVAGKLRRDGARISISFGSELILTMRAQAMSRCLTNLIGNAVRYGGAVEIMALRRDDMAEILIDDDGPGIPLQYREQVFKPFFRLESSRNPKTGGVGLGMTIARDVARGHGGDVRLEQSPAGGLRVRLLLPF
jgi:two-component system osmolarity sensor histidine kinase EnvZ